MTTKLLTPTGRAATSQPEIQNIPMHTPDGDAIRRAFCTPLVPMVDLGILEKTYVGIFRDQPFGEIREYLPKEESHE